MVARKQLREVMTFSEIVKQKYVERILHVTSQILSRMSQYSVSMFRFLRAHTARVKLLPTRNQ
jgi:hypothetical protein